MPAVRVSLPVETTSVVVAAASAAGAGVVETVDAEDVVSPDDAAVLFTAFEISTEEVAADEFSWLVDVSEEESAETVVVEVTDVESVGVVAVSEEVSRGATAVESTGASVVTDVSAAVASSA